MSAPLAVKFFSSFTDSENCAAVYLRVLQHLDLPYYGNELVVTTGEEYDCAVLLNVARPELRLPKERVLGLAFEPLPFLGFTSDFILYCQEHVGRYYVGDASELPPPFISHHGFMWHCPFPRTIAPKQNANIMSIVFSMKDEAPGHRYRHELVRRILADGLPVDIWGRGCQSLSDIADVRVRGEFIENEPYEGYLFTVAIENFQLPDYISEKFTNALLHETTPVYLGASNVEKYFPNSSVPLAGELENDVRTIEFLLRHPEECKTIDRFAVLRKLNLLDHLKELWSPTPDQNNFRQTDGQC
ncbi:MAG: glycosyltransferase family 10 domain-containing protein [Sulfobacillus sp.]